jgi:ribosomal protein L7/L12
MAKMESYNYGSVGELAARVQRLEAQVRFLLARLNIDPAEFEAVFQPGALTLGQMDELKSLLRHGNKIGAIKYYREYTGFGLKEAKDAMDLLEKNL